MTKNITLSHGNGGVENNELISKVFYKAFKNDILQKYEGTLFKNREDLLRLITCGYVTDDDLHKRPLSKLIKDISQELGLV